jgi:methylenetetrahydrofolate reductase (NADPH)
MSLASFYQQDRPAISFELFPPKTEAGQRALEKHVGELMQFEPAYITCTYGAGGSTRDKTLEIVTAVKQQFQVSVASHLTCVGSTVDQLRDYLGQARDAGIDFIVALRGDPPADQHDFQVTEGGFQYANQLVSLIHSEFAQFGIAVAGYPEVHQEAPNADVDLQNLKRKVDAGADVVITQLFYNNDDFFRFRDSCDSAGITVPVVPGILPVTSLAQIQRIASLCKATLPEELTSRLGQQEDADWQFEVGVEHAVCQVADLLAGGVPGLHLYVLNRSQATIRVLGHALQSGY